MRARLWSHLRIRGPQSAREHLAARQRALERLSWTKPFVRYTFSLNTHWEPEPRIVDEVNRGRDERVHEERALSHSGRSWSPPPGDADDVPASGPSGSGTSSPSARSTRSLSSLSTHTPTSLAAEHTGKKSSRSEGERRRTLEDDEWTMRVTPHEVVCRGCRRSIKLDRRSRYYPGLWEKHRDRCEHVAKMRRLLEDEVSGNNAMTRYVLIFSCFQAGPSHHAQQPPPFEAGPAYSAPAALRRTQSWTFDPAAQRPGQTIEGRSMHVPRSLCRLYPHRRCIILPEIQISQL